MAKFYPNNNWNICWINFILILAFLSACSSGGTGGGGFSNLFSTPTALPPPLVTIIPAPNAEAAVTKFFDALQKDDYLVLLEERGKQMNSEGLAAFIQLRGNESVKNIIFLIGGAYGVSDAIMQRANYTWSLSALVFPHQLVRLIVAEQVYRACSINRNEKYHHS